MRILSARVVGASFLVCFAAAVAGGALFALLGERVLAYGIGTGLLIVGIGVLWVALLGATEPAEGWARRWSGGQQGARRSLVGRLAADRSLEGVSSLTLALWGVAVGAPLVALSMLAFFVAA